MHFPTRFEHAVTAVFIPGAIATFFPVASGFAIIQASVQQDYHIIYLVFLLWVTSSIIAGAFIETKTWNTEILLDAQLKKILKRNRTEEQKKNNEWPTKHYRHIPIYTYNQVFFCLFLDKVFVGILSLAAMFILFPIFFTFNFNFNFNFIILIVITVILIVLLLSGFQCCDTHKKIKKQEESFKNKDDTAGSEDSEDFEEQWFQYLSWATEYNIIGFKFIAKMVERLYLLLGSGHAFMLLAYQLLASGVLALSAFFNDAERLALESEIWAMIVLFMLALALLCFMIAHTLFYKGASTHRSLNYTRKNINENLKKTVGKSCIIDANNKTDTGRWCCFPNCARRKGLF